MTFNGASLLHEGRLGSDLWWEGDSPALQLSLAEHIFPRVVEHRGDAAWRCSFFEDAFYEHRGLSPHVLSTENKTAGGFVRADRKIPERKQRNRSVGDAPVHDGAFGDAALIVVGECLIQADDARTVRFVGAPKGVLPFGKIPGQNDLNLNARDCLERLAGEQFLQNDA